MLDEPRPRHNYEFWNRAVDFEQARREGLLLALARRARVTEILAKGGVAVALALVAVLALWLVPWPAGMAPAGPVSPAPATAVTADPGPAPPVVKQAEEDAREAGEVTNYTLFREVPAGVPGLGRVVTGSNFARSTDTSPFEEYCYVEVDDPAPGLSRKFVLATIGSAAARQLNWSDAALDAIGLDRDQAKTLISSCRFMGVTP